MFCILLAITLYFSVSYGSSFLWGTAGASYQIEGAVDVDGRKPSIWDTFCSIPNKCAKNASGNPADDNYYLYELDAKLASDMGTNAYRLSIAWPRILPDGINVNPAGISHYHKVFDALEKYKLEPFVTMYHWDLPEAVYNITNGGWINSTIVDYFVRYAKVLLDNFSNRTKYWLTFNEPWTFCVVGYGTGEHAPGRCSDRGSCEYGNSSTEPYLCSHNVLLSHSKVSKLFHSNYSKINNGKIGITLNNDFGYPMTNSTIDKNASLRYLQFEIGWFADPIFIGDYPLIMRELVGDRLPKFTQEEIDNLKGSSDFYGMNHYTGKWIANKTYPNQEKTWFTDQQTDNQAINYNGTPIGTVADSDWLYVVPSAIRDVLNYVSNRYNKPQIYITENGVDCINETLILYPNGSYLSNDSCRINFYSQYLDNVLKAKKKDGIKVKSYFAWSLLDNFEWADGYTKRFGLHYVDYNSSNFTRYRKQSSFWYQNFIRKQTKNSNNKTLSNLAIGLIVGGVGLLALCIIIILVIKCCNSTSSKVYSKISDSKKKSEDKSVNESEMSQKLKTKE